MLKAIIFDFDGLVIDTEMPDFLSWQEIYQEHNAPFALEDWLPLVGTGPGTSPFNIFDHFEEKSGKTFDREAIRQQRIKRHLELIANQPILPGVEDLIHEAKRNGLLLAVASSSPRSWVAGHLKERDLLSYFDAIACGDEVRHAKPRPDVYQSALAQLGVEPHEAIALEDSLNGMRAALAAGIFCVAVPNPLTSHFDFSEASLRLTSLTELSLANIHALIERAGTSTSETH
ncbi:HAD family hydrolase [Ktedonospora formicarum]|uniref:Haloacid dehalogenase n=1 Tax=Ktedonospora formicarum TaxID=2778364 RepID=A0A8J3HY71_9CHLR|nr:HAD family hydrolase [Ktedonospora formicarum]GHO46382.1 hypothetical protein KSX_45450 [Ktedonospora formicarum]